MSPLHDMLLRKMADKYGTEHIQEVLDEIKTQKNEVVAPGEVSGADASGESDDWFNGTGNMGNGDLPPGSMKNGRIGGIPGP